MGLLNILFGVKDKEIIIPQAKVIKMETKPDPEQEFRDLNERHSEFFTGAKTPQQQMQPQIGAEIGAKITDVTLSRSDTFFKEAPEVSYPDFHHNESFERLENYMHIPVEQEEALITIENEVETAAEAVIK